MGPRSADLIALRRALQEDRQRQAIAAAGKLSAQGFPNIEARATCACAHAALNELEKAEFRRDIYRVRLRE